VAPSSKLVLKPTVAKSEDMIEPIQDHFVVRDDDDGGILIDRDLAQQVRHNSGALRIQRGGRLISQNNGARSIGKGARDRNPLRLSARKLRGRCMLAMPNF
jgi:hypothetical protein